MSPKGLFWCGKGDLFSRRSLKEHKLYTRYEGAKDQKCQKHRIKSHFQSHARQEASGPPLGAAFVDAFRALSGLRPITGEVTGWQAHSVPGFISGALGRKMGSA